MFIVFSVFILIGLFTIKYSNGFDVNYLSKENSSVIKGIFVLLVFFSHARTYFDITLIGDQYVVKILNSIGQLMVTMFLFYSGYGVFESIKRKKEKYINEFPIKRIGYTFLDFTVAIMLFWIMNLCLGKHYPISKVLLSLTGWTGIGNSNWYMFAIFTLYIITYVCFRISMNKNLISICLVTFCSLIYCFILSQIQPDRFSNTYLCYVFGMWFSFFKETIDMVLKRNNLFYYISLLIIIFIFMYTYPNRFHQILYYNFVSIVFVLLIILISMRISFKNKIFDWFGKHVFWVYILQRIPMIILAQLGIFIEIPILFLISTLGMTIILTIIFNSFSQWWKNMLNSRLYIKG